MKKIYEVLDNYGHLAPAGEITEFPTKAKAVSHALKLTKLTKETECVNISADQGFGREIVATIEVTPEGKTTEAAG